MNKSAQGSDDDTVKVSHANKLCSSNEAGKNDANVSTLATFSSYSGYPTDISFVVVSTHLVGCILMMEFWLHFWLPLFWSQ